MIHRKGQTIVVTKGPRETRIRTEEAVLDFVGTSAERGQVTKLWQEIQAEKEKRKTKK